MHEMAKVNQGRDITALLHHLLDTTPHTSYSPTFGGTSLATSLSIEGFVKAGPWIPYTEGQRVIQQCLIVEDVQWTLALNGSLNQTSGLINLYLSEVVSKSLQQPDHRTQSFSASGSLSAHRNTPPTLIRPGTACQNIR